MYDKYGTGKKLWVQFLIGAFSGKKSEFFFVDFANLSRVRIQA